MSAVISTSDVCRFFGDEDETLVKAVDHVSIEIERGEFTAIVGPSGSGKTTLLHLIGGLDNPTSGSIHLAGTNIAEMSGTALSDFRRDHIGFIFQAYNLIPVFSAEENIEYIMLLQGIDAADGLFKGRGGAGLGDLSGGKRTGQFCGDVGRDP